MSFAIPLQTYKVVSGQDKILNVVAKGSYINTMAQMNGMTPDKELNPNTIYGLSYPDIEDVAPFTIEEDASKIYVPLSGVYDSPLDAGLTTEGVLYGVDNQTGIDAPVAFIPTTLDAYVQFSPVCAGIYVDGREVDMNTILASLEDEDPEVGALLINYIMSLTPLMMTTTTGAQVKETCPEADESKNYCVCMPIWTEETFAEFSQSFLSQLDGAQTVHTYAPKFFTIQDFVEKGIVPPSAM